MIMPSSVNQSLDGHAGISLLVGVDSLNGVNVNDFNYFVSRSTDCVSLFFDKRDD
jgi:hypothetical protein